MRALALSFVLALLSVPAGASSLKLEFAAASEADLVDPQDMTLSADGRLLYVADTGNDRIAVLDAETLELRDSIGDAILRSPRDVHLGADGLLYVADARNDRVVILRPQGTSATEVGWFDTDGSPASVARHPRGPVLVVGDRTNELMVFDNGRRVLRGAFRVLGPRDVDVDADGDVWVADSLRDRVVQFAISGDELTSFGGRKLGLRRPTHLSSGMKGVVWVSNRGARRVLAIDTANGAILAALGGAASGSGPTRLLDPLGIVASSDSVWISDVAADRIVRYRVVR